MIIRRFSLFHAADDGSTIAAGNLSVPVVAPPERAGPVDVTLPVSPGVEKAASRAIDAAKEIGLALPKTRSPKDLGLDLNESDEVMGSINARLEGGQKAERRRGPDGRYLPKEGESAVEIETPEAGAPPKATPVKPEAVKPEAKPVTTPPKAPTKPLATQAAPPKIKIGKIEKTEAEWEKHFADLEAKKQQPEVPQEPEAPAAPEPTIEDRRAAFLTGLKTKFTEAYKPDPAKIDSFLASGDPAQLQELLFDAVAFAADDTRVHFAKEVNDSLAPIYDMIQKLAPMVDVQQQIADHQRDQQFLAQFPDIQQNPAGAVTVAAVRKSYDDAYAEIQQLASQGKASKLDQGWALTYEGLDAEARNEVIATEVRNRLAASAAPQTVTPTTPAAPAAPRVPAAKPFNGDRPGGASVVKAPMTLDQKRAAEMLDYVPST